MTDPNMTASEAAGAQLGASVTADDYYTNDRRQRAVSAALNLAQHMLKPVTIDEFLTNVAKIDAYLENGKTEETK